VEILGIKIGIDGRALQGKRSGVGRYVFELCKELDKQLPEATFFVYSNILIEMPVISERWKLRLDPLSFTKYIKPVIWLKLFSPRLCKKDNLDVYWGPATFLPRLTDKVKKIVTVHDINYVIVPETMSATHRFANLLFFKSDIRRADILTANSFGTSEKIKKVLNRTADKVIYPSVDQQKLNDSIKNQKEILEIYNLNSPYILAVATWEPRKNLELLLSVFLDLKREKRLSNYNLVLVGGRGWKDSKLNSIITSSESREIKPLGYISDEHLGAIYAGAEVFVFPSIYEGFGIPVLEARVCGTKVITSNIPELMEAGGEDTEYITPTYGELKRALLEIDNITYRNDFKVVFNTWEFGAKELAELFKKFI
jgi:glycosyltransferase involved in cell wall biosynthesis